jgi:hypothetical protein
LQHTGTFASIIIEGSSHITKRPSNEDRNTSLSQKDIRAHTHPRVTNTTPLKNAWHVAEQQTGAPATSSSRSPEGGSRGNTGAWNRGGRTSRSEGLKGLRLPAVETISDEPRIKLNLSTGATKKATSEPAVDGTLQDELRRGR